MKRLFAYTTIQELMYVCLSFHSCMFSQGKAVRNTETAKTTTNLRGLQTTKKSDGSTVATHTYVASHHLLTHIEFQCLLSNDKVFR